jgi:opacity protein-like surface antigen
MRDGRKLNSTVECGFQRQGGVDCGAAEKMKPMRNFLVLSLAFAVGLPWAAAGAAESARDGFYGGIALRDATGEQGIAIRDASNPWGRLAPVVAEGPGSQALVYGGYRWRRDVALEAALGSESYRLPGRGGVGLVLPLEDDSASRRWNVDVQGSWAFWRSLSLYGRMGYSQSEIAPYYRTSVVANPGEVRTRDGLNYGVGLRYDLTRSLGVRLEYARTGVFGGEAVSGPPHDDQVQFGLQFRF